MRWPTVFSVASVVVSLATFAGSGGAAGTAHAASAVSPTATSEPRFIREAQRTLGELGYRPGPIDGVVGRRTRSALTRYQRSERIPVTGHLDAETLVRLDIHQRVSPASDRREGARAGHPSARPAS
jgi:peptidoglycan hydrolase-like protein with peptidoglycan-binding domain